MIVGLWGISQPSPWRDEAVTMAVARRSPGQILHLAGHVDAVLTPYYLLMHFATTHSLYSMRVASVVFAALGGAGVVWLGFLVGGLRRLRVGAWAGVVYVADPLTSRYAQEARPYALALLLAVLSTCFFARWLHGRRRFDLVAYVVVTIALGYANLLALLLLAAHAVTVVALRGLPGLRRWLMPMSVVAAALTPLGIFAWRERAAMGWQQKPSGARLAAVVDQLGGGDETALLLLLLALVCGLALARGGKASSMTRTRLGSWRPTLSTRGPAPRIWGLHDRRVLLAMWTAWPWLILPPLLLFAVSQISPMFSDRYLLFCVPALCLLAGVGLALVPWPLASGLAGLFAYLLVPAQHGIRGPVGHNEDVRGTATAVASAARPGDAVVFVPSDRRVVEEAYPSDFRAAADVLLAESAARDGSLAGRQVSAAAAPRAILTHRKVILVSSPTWVKAHPGNTTMAILRTRYQLARQQQFAGFTVSIYVKP
jgi:mannosyltransferase